MTTLSRPMLKLTSLATMMFSAMLSSQVQAADCPASISGSQGNCTLADGVNTTITGTGSVFNFIDTPNSDFSADFTIDNGGRLFDNLNTSAALYHESSTWTGNINNSGQIDGNGTDGQGITFFNAILNGNINNTATGEIEGGREGIRLNLATITGGIFNDGIIQSTTNGGGTQSGIFLSASDIQGGINNTGTIRTRGNAFNDYAINIENSTFTGGITNSGNIINTIGTAMDASDTGRGINIRNSTWTGENNGGVALENQVGGLISNGLWLIDSTVTGAINNAGDLLNNTGDTSGLAAIQIDSTGGSGSDISGLITNSGTIRSWYATIIQPNSNLSGGILNSGTFQGTGTDGVALFNRSPNIINFENSGTVIGDLQKANVTLTGGSITGDITGALTFATAATMTGNVSGSLTVNDGVAATITGNYTQGASDVFTTRVSGNNSYGSVSVTGTALLPSNANIFVDVNAINTLSTGTLSSVLSAGTLISDGTFNLTDNSALFDFTAILNGNAVDLSAQKLVSVFDATNTNGVFAGLGAATVFDGLIDNGGGTAQMDTVLTALGQLATEREVANAVESTLPAVSGGVAQLTNLTTNAVTEVVRSRQSSTRGMSSGEGFITDRHLWLKPFGGWTEQDNRQGVTGYDIDSYGLALGMDGDLSPSWQAGFAFAYINGDVDSNLAAGAHNIDMDSYQAKVYGSKLFDAATALNLQAGIGMSDYDSRRRIFTGDVADADYDSWNVQLSAELERSYQINANTLMTPYISAEYGYVKVDSYRESGANALNLNVNDDSNDSLVLGAGVKGSHLLTEQLLLLANAGLGYDVMTEQSKLTSSFAGGGANFTTEGIEPDEWVYKAGLGAQYNTANGTEITASYNFSGREDYTDQSVSVNFRLMF